MEGPGEFHLTATLLSYHLMSSPVNPEMLRSTGARRNLHIPNQLMTSSNVFTAIPGEAEYQAAVEEFDALWNSGPRSDREARMDELILLIEAFEQRRMHVTSLAPACQA
jgi:hypothetical protein